MPTMPPSPTLRPNPKQRIMNNPSEVSLFLIIGLVLFAGVAAWCRTLAEKQGYRDTSKLHEAESEATRHSSTEKYR